MKRYYKNKLIPSSNKYKPQIENIWAVEQKKWKRTYVQLTSEWYYYAGAEYWVSTVASNSYDVAESRTLIRTCNKQKTAFLL